MLRITLTPKQADCVRFVMDVQPEYYENLAAEGEIPSIPTLLSWDVNTLLVPLPVVQLPDDPFEDLMERMDIRVECLTNEAADEAVYNESRAVRNELRHTKDARERMAVVWAGYPWRRTSTTCSCGGDDEHGHFPGCVQQPA